MSTIYKHDVPHVGYDDNGTFVWVDIAILLKLGDLMVRRADGEIVSIDLAGFWTTEGELISANADSLSSREGESVSVRD